MDAIALNVKLYLADPGAVALVDFIPVFHEWIRVHRLDEVLIDVADYAHVQHGPGVLLVGHDAHYAIDEQDGELGLLYSRKRGASEPDLERRIARAFEKALFAAYQLERDQMLAGKLRFRGDRSAFRILDRLRAPNVDATLQVVRPALDRVLARLYAGARYEISRESDPKQPFGLRITVDADPDVETLLGRARG